MLVHRCAWHRRYFGYVAYLRVVWDGRWRVTRSDGICRPCRDVMLATARGEAPKSVSIKRELARAALALTAVAAYALLILLAGCSESPAFAVGECVSLKQVRERWEGAGTIMRVAEVGAKSYRVEFWYEDRREFIGSPSPAVKIGKDWNLARVACPR